jgi:imidazolonepropionase-like amidohydrolase
MHRISIFIPLAFLAGLSWLVSLMLAPSLATASIKPDTLLIREVYLVSAEAQISAAPVNVLIKNGRISAIGSKEYPAAQILEGKGQYLIPGLIDTHVHLDGVPGFTPTNDTESAIYQQALTQIPRSYLYFGFTNVLDLASTKEAIAQWNNQPLAPHANFCAPVPIPGGYPLAMMPEEMQASIRHLLHDHHSHPHKPGSTDQTPHQIIEKISTEDAICVKIFYEKGFGPMRNLPVPSQKIIRELVSAAQDHSLPVYLHGNSASAYEFGLATGVDMMVHGLWHKETLTEQQLDKLADSIAKAGIAVQPTVQVLFGEQELFNPNFFNDPQSRAAVPASLLAWYQTEAGQWMTNMIGEDFSSGKAITDAERYQRVTNAYAPILNNVVEFSRKLKARKAPLVFGSDTPSGPIYTQFPGLNGHLEIQRWHQLGIELPEIFRALTINNARVLGAEKDLGSIEPGKMANLLLLDKNPLIDISAYDSIKWVILKGQPIMRESLVSE